MPGGGVYPAHSHSSHEQILGRRHISGWAAHVGPAQNKNVSEKVLDILLELVSDSSDSGLEETDDVLVEAVINETTLTNFFDTLIDGKNKSSKT